MHFDLFLVGVLELTYSIATLSLSAVGLALIFGLMRVINLAHGEFIVLGSYAAIVAFSKGCNFWVAILVVSPLVVGCFGFVVERLVISRLYGRTIDTLLATWGLSLAMSGAFAMIFGTTTTGIPNPIGPIVIGQYQIGGYSLFVVAITSILIIALYLVLRLSRIGMIVRGAMQSAEVAASLGHSPQRIYMSTFVVGSMVSGFAGGVLAPLVGIAPGAGAQFIAKAFITVISGGATVVAGTLSASVLLGSVSKVFEILATPVAGEMALLVAAMMLLRLLPQGITSRWFKGSA